MRIRLFDVVTPLLLLAMTGCEGSLGAMGAGGENGSGNGKSGQIGNGLTGDDWEAQAFSDGELYSPTLRLTKLQYSRVVGQAFGTDLQIPELPSNESTGLHRDYETPALADYESYVNAAVYLGEQLAPSLVAACDFGADPRGCAAEQLAEGLQILYRQPVSTADTDSLGALIEEVNSDGDVENAVAHSVALALLDPRFLYRLESGAGEVDELGGIQTTDVELASRLSFLAWDSSPDSESFALASNNNFTASIESESSRMFSQSEAGESIWQFVRTWLRLGDLSVETDPLKRAMLEETKLFVEHVLVREDAPFEDLFTAEYSFINAELAAHYGVPAPEKDWELYEFPEGSRRHGILTHGSFLSANSAHTPDIAWIFRGKVVFEHLFCGTMPPPPPGAADVEVESRLTTPTCAGCHTAVDPMGQFFDRYDEYGALRPEGLEAGTVSLGSDIDADYEDISTFLDAVADSRAFYHCFVKNWFQTALGRELGARDQASFDTALSAFEETLSLRAMFEAMASTPSFSTIYPKPSDMVCQ